MARSVALGLTIFDFSTEQLCQCRFPPSPLSWGLKKCSQASKKLDAISPHTLPPMLYLSRKTDLENGY